jgi:hypothetical protein
MPAPEEFITEDHLDEIEESLESITPGPWYWAMYDDVHRMSMLAVTTEEGDGADGGYWPNFDGGTLVAATLIQEPRYVDIKDARWQQNVQFIARCRTDVPNLVREVRRLRALLAERSS